jgi:hypothetical protein
LPVVLMAALAAALFVAPAAQATFHEILIREVYPGSIAQPDSDYVELQMYTGGQELVSGHSLTVYGPGGAVSGTFTFSSNVPGGASQQTILVGDSGVQEAFGLAPDLTSATFSIDASGGAACWAGSFDCVAWGNFSGSTPSPSGSPADPFGIPNGMALRRTIEPGCPTLLQAGDDSNASAADFFDSAPQPRNNASAVVEKPCNGPAVTIDAKPANPTKLTGASFTYHSVAGASFECKLDSGAFVSCDAGGVGYAGPLGEGSHTFQVRAKSDLGIVGNPASYTWRIDTTAPTAILDSHPADSSSGASVPFTFHASEAGSSFECSLALEPAGDSFSSCASGKTYTGLVDGEYTFKVRASDAAGNQGAATTFEWTVDNNAADTTPPETLIDNKPANPSSSADAAFTYHSTEPGSSFECKLDGAPFGGCPATGVAYSGLVNGTHTFQVRAIDSSTNVDQTPAGYSFDIAVPVSPATPPATPVVAPAVSPVPSPVASPIAKKRQKPRRCRRGKRQAKHRSGKRCSRGKSKPRPGATASTFHLVMLREVYPGSATNPDAEYVELQMYVPGQELVHGHQISFFDKAGGLLGSTVFDSDVARGASQSTIVAATPQAESQFGFVADEGMPGGLLDPAGGAACWETLDCATWGSFNGSLGSPTGSPADPLGIPDGMALRRTIAPACPTLLEIGDDRNDSAGDFAAVFPAPRPNSTAPSERACGSGAAGLGDPYGPAAGAGSRGRAPQTRIRRGPGGLTSDRTPTFRFSSSANGSTFLCKLDGAKFKRCRSPFTAPMFSLGPHVFRVKARSRDGAVDRSAAIRPFTVTRSSQ